MAFTYIPSEKIRELLADFKEDESFEDKCFHLESEILDLSKKMSRVKSALDEILEGSDSYLKHFKDHHIGEEIKTIHEDFSDVYTKVLKVAKLLKKLSDE